MRTVVPLALGLALVLAAQAAPRADDAAGELARTLQRKYETIRDFSTDFVHTYAGGVLRKSLSERGHLLVKKPGRMRWEYTSPEQKLFVSDGTKLYSYIPQDKQVIVSAVPRDDTAQTPALFLAGKGDITRDFTATIVAVPAGLTPGSKALKLVPTSPQREYDWLILVVDPASYGLRGLVTVDAQGGESTFSFANLKENVGLTDNQFTFKIPRGVDVISDAAHP